jgi:hypothetical protein
MGNERKYESRKDETNNILICQSWGNESVSILRENIPPLCALATEIAFVGLCLRGPGVPYLLSRLFLKSSKEGGARVDI